MKESVVAGADGSVSALDAVRVAATEAIRHGTSLRIVHALRWPVLAVPPGPSSLDPSPLGPSSLGPSSLGPSSLGPSPPGLSLLGSPLLDPAGGGLLYEAERILVQARGLAEQTAPGLAVETRLITGAPVPVLLEQAAAAELVVLGDRGLGGFTGLLVGSVVVQLAAYSPVPLLVVKGNIATEGPVVAGVDGSPGSVSTLDWAVREAAIRDTTLHAVHTRASRAPEEEEDEDVLEAALAEHDLTGVRVRRETLHAPTARTLIQLSETAQLVVVGSRGRGGFPGLLLGSVSQHLLHHAHCPVMIVPHARRRQ